MPTHILTSLTHEAERIADVMSADPHAAHRLAVELGRKAEQRPLTTAERLVLLAAECCRESGDLENPMDGRKAAR